MCAHGEEGGAGGTYDEECGDHEVPPAGDGDVEERAHVCSGDAGADDLVVDLAVGGDELWHGRGAAVLLCLEGELLELGADELALELGRLVRVVRLGELPVVFRVERGLGIDGRHPEDAC